MAKLFVSNSNTQAVWFSPDRGGRAGSYGAWLITPSSVQATVACPPWDMSRGEIEVMIAATTWPPGLAVDSIED
jgi:hypothetical protein